MSLDFLRNYNGRRAGIYGDAPGLFSPETNEDEDPTEETGTQVDLDYEISRNQWSPIKLGDLHGCESETDGSLWTYLPLRYVDGKDVGRTAVWVESPSGLPVPIRVAQIGATALCATRNDPHLLTLGLDCESRTVEKVVAFEADMFPWNEVESFAAALQANGFRLLIAKRRTETKDFDFPALQNTTNKRTTEEMFRLERQAIRGNCSASVSHFPQIPTVADGRLEDKTAGFSPTAPVFGVIKKQWNWDYLHTLGYQVYFSLKPCERTPAFLLDRHLPVVTWYVRTDALEASGPTEGVIRIEVSQEFYERVIGRRNFDFLNRLSRYLIRCRTKDSGYGRAAVTLYPIQRAEEILSARFASQDRVITDFYHLTGV
jgi:hypothetical protein